MKEITFKCDKRANKRAYYWSRSQFRWFPTPLTEAELAVATGGALFVPITKAVKSPGTPRGW